MTETFVILALSVVATASITYNVIQYDLRREANERAEDAAKNVSGMARQLRRRYAHSRQVHRRDGAS